MSDFDLSNLESYETAPTEQDAELLERRLVVKAYQTLEELMAEGGKGDEVRRQAATDVLKHFSVDKKGHAGGGAQTMNIIGDDAVRRMLTGLREARDLTGTEGEDDYRRVSTGAFEENGQ